MNKTNKIGYGMNTADLTVSVDNPQALKVKDLIKMLQDMIKDEDAPVHVVTSYDDLIDNNVRYITAIKFIPGDQYKDKDGNPAPMIEIDVASEDDIINDNF
jgi:hypothetical protein